MTAATMLVWSTIGGIAGVALLVGVTLEWRHARRLARAQRGTMARLVSDRTRASSVLGRKGRGW